MFEMEVITTCLLVDRKDQIGGKKTNDEKERRYGQVLKEARKDRLKKHDP